MYSTSNNYKSKIYEPSTRHLLKIYLDDTLINNKYVLGVKQTHELFTNEEFTLGSITAKSIELKLHKSVVPSAVNRVYIVSGIENEEVPVGYFNVDEINREDNYTVTLKLIDDMIKFEFNYDGSKLIEQEGYAEIIDILEDICKEAEVELGSTSFLNMHKHISVYDNTVSARTYLSYIAEQAGGFACIGRDGKLYIKAIGQDTVEIPLKYFQNYTWGNKFLFTRVKYEDGVQLFEHGDTTGNTIYISQDNMYIVDQEQIDNIYSQLNGLEVYSFEGNSIIDPALDIGDILLIDNKKVIYQGSSEYAGKFKASISSKIQSKEKEETMMRKPSEKTMIRRVQSEIDQVNGRISSIIEQQEEQTSQLELMETTIDGIKNTLMKSGGNNLFYYSTEYWQGENVPSFKRNIQVGDDLSGKTLYLNFPTEEPLEVIEIDMPSNIITCTNGAIIHEGVEDASDPENPVSFERVSVTQETVEIDRIYNMRNGSYISGETEYVLPDDFGRVTSIDEDSEIYQYIQIEIPETVLPVNLAEYTDTEFKNNTVSGRGYIVNEGYSIQDTTVTKTAVPNGTYAVSFKYKKIGPALSNASVKINREEISLTETNWTDVAHVIEVTTNHITVEFISDTDNSLYVADLMGNPGTEATIWTQHPNETITDTVTIGEGITVQNSVTNTYTKIDADGNRTYNAQTGEVVAEMIDKGANIKELIVREKAQIAGLLIQQVGNQTWISSLL